MVRKGPPFCASGGKSERGYPRRYVRRPRDPHQRLVHGFQPPRGRRHVLLEQRRHGADSGGYVQGANQNTNTTAIFNVPSSRDKPCNGLELAPSPVCIDMHMHRMPEVVEPDRTGAWRHASAKFSCNPPPPLVPWWYAASHRGMHMHMMVGSSLPVSPRVYRI